MLAPMVVTFLRRTVYGDEHDLTADQREQLTTAVTAAATRTAREYDGLTGELLRTVLRSDAVGDTLADGPAPQTLLEDPEAAATLQDEIHTAMQTELRSLLDSSVGLGPQTRTIVSEFLRSLRIELLEDPAVLETAQAVFPPLADERFESELQQQMADELESLRTETQTLSEKHSEYRRYLLVCFILFAIAVGALAFLLSNNVV